MTTCHIAGLVKGVIEHDDGTTHFGSTMGYNYHLNRAKELGVVAENAGKLEATPFGIRWYEEKKMALLPYPSRSSSWRLIKGYDDWALPADQSDIF